MPSPPHDLRDLLGHAVPTPVSEVWSTDVGPEMQALVDAGFAELLSPTVSRLLYAAGGGSGMQVYVSLAPKLSLSIVNGFLPSPMRKRFVADEPVLLMRASLACDCAYQVPGTPAMVFNRPEIVLAYVPQFTELTIDMTARVRQHGVIAFVRAPDFLTQFGLRSEDVPASMLEALSGRGTAGRLATLPLDAKLAALVDAMTQPPGDPSLLRLYLNGKLQELVAMMLDASGRDPAFAGHKSLRQRDVDLAYLARERLDREFSAPPRLSDLAHQLGTNQNKLGVVFREVFGTTMADYCVERRMREAQTLLLEGRLSIGQIAERTGYEHQSSFTSTFRAHVGMTPREYQQHRAAINVALPSSPGKPGAVASD